MRVRRLICRVRITGATPQSPTFRPDTPTRPELAFLAPAPELPTIAEEEVPETTDPAEDFAAERPNPREIADRVYEFARREIERGTFGPRRRR